MLTHSYSVDKVLTYQTTTGQVGCIILGKVLSSDQKPCFVVLNRSKDYSCIIGPNKIYYDALSSQEYKVIVPPGYLNQLKNPLTDTDQPHIEVYGCIAGKTNIKLANHMNEMERGCDA